MQFRFYRELYFKGVYRGSEMVCKKLKIGGLPLFKPLCRRGLREGYVVGEFWVGEGF